MCIILIYIIKSKVQGATEEVKEDLKKYAADKLSKYENPRLWEFREELPLTAVGKVLKRSLRDETK